MHRLPMAPAVVEKNIMMVREKHRITPLRNPGQGRGQKGVAAQGEVVSPDRRIPAFTGEQARAVFMHL
ncbi:MAG: hypothetical protein ACK55I_34375, partial [bacterium]